MMGSAGITNVGPINTPTTNAGAIAGFDPVLKMSKRETKKRKKMEGRRRNGADRKGAERSERRETEIDAKNGKKRK